MTREETIEGLLSCARQSDDTAASCEASARHHRPEYEANIHCAPPEEVTPEVHERTLELYGHVINNEHEARRLRKEAELFREAVRMLERDSEKDSRP